MISEILERTDERNQELICELLNSSDLTDHRKKEIANWFDVYYNEESGEFENNNSTN